MKDNYGFVPDLSSSTRQNSIRVLGDMSPSTYFERPHHLEFHDFTPGRQLPPAAKLILDSPTSLCQDMKSPPHGKKTTEAFERLENDFNWRVNFAGEHDSFKPKKLYVKSELRAPLPPHQFGLRMSAFELKFKKLFGRRPKMKSNLPKFLENLLSNLRGMKQIIFASADKNLGPVAVAL